MGPRSKHILCFFGLNNYSSVIISRDRNFMNHSSGDNDTQTNRGSLLQLATTSGLVVIGSRANCNTLNISKSDLFRKYSIDGIQPTKHKDSEPGVKSRTRINNYIWQNAKWSLMTKGQVVTKFIGQVITDFRDLLTPICGKMVACICFVSSNLFFCAWWTQVYFINRALYLRDIISKQLLSKQLIYLSMFLLKLLVTFKCIVLSEH